MTRTPIPERSATTDFIHDAARLAAQHGLRFFLLGATEEANAEAARILQETYPGLQIVGRRHGYFCRDEEDEICDEINLTLPDVIWVGLSVPLEYEFAVRNKARLSAGWLVTCGGCYNFVTGAYARAPRWMQAAGLEWLFRLIREPKRLFWRYAVTNPLAIFLLLTRTSSAVCGAIGLCASMAISDIARGRILPDGACPAACWAPPCAMASRPPGPVAVSGAHFLASLIFLRNLPAREFGLFSFVMVVVSFGMSLNASLITVPLTRHMVTGADDTRRRLLPDELAGLHGFCRLAVRRSAGVAMPRSQDALLLALFARRLHLPLVRALLCLCRRPHGGRHPVRPGLQPAAGGLGLAILAFAHQVSFMHGSEMLLLAALAALLPFGLGLLPRPRSRPCAGSPRRYWPIFRDLTRWSLMGVVLTEVTVNAHAYLVTFISGAGSFALLALGMLLMRPASLMQSALPDLERPAMTRAIAAGDMAALSRIQRHFTWGLVAAWLVNVLLCAALLAFFPLLVLKKGYALHDVILVAILSSVIMAIRAWRTPLAVLLQAAGAVQGTGGHRHRSPARSPSSPPWRCCWPSGPIASLGGILLGELVILARVIADGARLEGGPMADTVVIAIPTFRRPKILKRLLDAIAALKTQAAISVLVADNDAEGHAGFDLCHSLDALSLAADAR